MEKLNKLSFLKNKIILFFILSLGILSAFYALYIANTYGSMDFQYSPTLLFKEKVNPYEYFLYNNNLDRIIGAQYPVYSHATYIFFYFFSFFDYETSRLIWSLINLSIGTIVGIIIGSYCKIDKKYILIIISLFFLSTPFRNCIGNGQTSLLILLCFCSVFIKHKYLRNFFYGFSYMKYSFMPLLAFAIFFKDGFKSLIISGLFCIIGWIVFSIYLDQNIIITIFQPLYAGLKGFDDTLTRGDLYSILSNLNFFKASKNHTYFLILIVILVSLFFGKKISKITDPILFLNLMCISNLMIFGHLIYDYIVLLPTLIYNFKNLNFKRSIISILIIFYFWYGIRFIEYLKMIYLKQEVIVPSSIDLLINFIMLIYLFLLNSKIQSPNLLKTSL